MIRVPAFLAFAVALAGLILTPCQAQDAPHSDNDDTVINVRAEDYALQAPEEIPSGWTTIEYTNEGEEPHLLFIARLPDGVAFDDYAGDVLVPFNEIWYTLRDDGIGQEEALERLGETLPEWFWAMEYPGGTGIVPAGMTSQATVHLKPGTYILECYVKTEDGELHNMEGMLRELTVSESASGAAAPEADVEITLTNSGMAIDGDLSPGTHTVAVHAEEEPEGGFPHNVHVAKVDPDTEVNELVRWINYMEVDGLMPPTPATFFGGMHVLSEGNTGYFTIDLEPGQYLFFSEFTSHMGVQQEVTVEP